MRDMTARFGDAWSYWVLNQEAEGDKCHSSTCCLLFIVRHPNLGDGACHIQAGSSFLREISLEAASQTDTQQYTSSENINFSVWSHCRRTLTITVLQRYMFDYYLLDGVSHYMAVFCHTIEL